jgi:hypothetical protein
MTRISLADITDEKPVRLTVEMPAKLHRDLQDYCLALSQGATAGVPAPERVIPAMIEKFIASDRSYARERKQLRRG